MFKLKKTTSLLPHQKEFVEVFESKRAMGLFDQQGLGKSLEILAAICNSLTDGEKALIVVPPHLQSNWQHEIEKFTYMVLGADIDILPYTQLGKKTNSFKDYRFVAADEAHYLKNLDAQRTQKFMYYLEEAVCDREVLYFLYATGTPLNNRIPEIYNFLLMVAGFEHVSPKIDVRYQTYYQFCERFCHVKSTNYGNKYHGMKNLEELKEYLKPWSIRRRADEVLTLPEMGNQNVYVDYDSDKDKELWNAWMDHVSVDDAYGGIDVRAKKEAAIAKAPFTAKWVQDELENGSGPMVVFTDHREPVNIISQELSKKWRVGNILGGDNMNSRAKLVEDFQEGKIDLLVATIGSASTGITLTKSNIVVFNDIPWKPSDLDQARKRIHRISQEKECRCIYIVGSRADDLIIQAIKDKLKVINAVVEGA